MYILIEFSENYLQTGGSSWLRYRYQPDLDNNGNIIDFLLNDDIILSFRYKEIVIDRTGNDGKKYWNMGTT